MVGRTNKVLVYTDIWKWEQVEFHREGKAFHAGKEFGQRLIKHGCCSGCRDLSRADWQKSLAFPWLGIWSFPTSTSPIESHCIFFVFPQIRDSLSAYTANINRNIYHLINVILDMLFMNHKELVRAHPLDSDSLPVLFSTWKSLDLSRA